MQTEKTRKDIKVQVIDDGNELIWERGQEAGIACRQYATNGMQEEIVNVLKNALTQAEVELVVFDDVDRVSDIGSTTA